jgi:transposase
MKPRFKTGINRKERVLFPESIDDYISKDHFCRFVLEIVSKLNIDNIIKKYKVKGQNAYSPVILLCIIIYGYSIGIRSSRKLAKACSERLDFMYLSSKLKPSYKVISEFRQRNFEELSSIFKEFVLIAIELGMIEVGKIKISIDGTKIKANASSKKSKDEKGLQKLLEEIDKEIEKIMKSAVMIDEEEDKEHGGESGYEVPEKIRKLQDRKGAIETTIKELKDRKLKLEEEIKAKRQAEGKREKLSKRENLKIENMKINISDPDAKYMKARNGCIKPCYNCQAGVTEEGQLIVSAEATTDCNDKNQLLSTLEKAEENLNASVNQCKADSGYHSISNLKELEKKSVKCFIDDPNKRKIDSKNYKYDKINFKYIREEDCYICPSGKKLKLISETDKRKRYKSLECGNCSAKDNCAGKKGSREITRTKDEELVEKNRDLIMSERGIEEYKKRMHTVEPVFGNIKFNMGYSYFLVRGEKKVKGEFNLMCIAHNIKKIFNYCKDKVIDIGKVLSMWKFEPCS